MVDPLLAFRAEFPILDRTTYLVSNSLGAMPRGVPDRLAEYVDEWAELGVRAWAGAYGWWRKPVEVGSEIAPLIGAAPGEVVVGHLGYIASRLNVDPSASRMVAISNRLQPV